MAQTKALVGVIAEMHCSIVAKMSTNSSKNYLGSILVNSAVCHNCGCQKCTDLSRGSGNPSRRCGVRRCLARRGWDKQYFGEIKNELFFKE